jgi:hypothetical protein
MEYTPFFYERQQRTVNKCIALGIKTYSKRMDGKIPRSKCTAKVCTKDQDSRE